MNNKIIQQYKPNLIKIQKRTFCQCYKKEMDKHEKEYDEISDTSSKASSKPYQGKQVETQASKGKESAIDDTSDSDFQEYNGKIRLDKGKGRAANSTLDSSSQKSSDSDGPREDKGKGKQIANTDTQYPGRDAYNTLDSSSQESNTSSVFDIPDQLKTKQTSMYQGNPGLGAGGPSTQPYLSDDESSTHTWTSSEFWLWSSRWFRQNIAKKLSRGENIHDCLDISQSSRRNSVSGANDNLPSEDIYRNANSDGSRVNKYEREELNLKVEKALNLSTKKTEKILRERDHMFDVTTEQIMNPRFTLSQLSLGGTSSVNKSESDSEKPEDNKAVHFSKGGSGGGPGNSSSGGSSSGAGGYGGPSGSGTIHFILENLDEVIVIFTYLLGIISTILVINPEILMYFRLMITLIREPAFKLYMYFKYINLLCLINKITNILCFFSIYLLRLVKTICNFIYSPFRILTNISNHVSSVMIMIPLA